MLKFYKYPLKVWITVVVFSTPLNYIFNNLFSLIPALEKYSVNMTYLNVLVNYLGSLIVCIPFWLVFWLIYYMFKKAGSRNTKVYMLLFSQLIWWLTFYLVLELNNSFTITELLITFSPYSIVLLLGVLGYQAADQV